MKTSYTLPQRIYHAARRLSPVVLNHEAGYPTPPMDGLDLGEMLKRQANTLKTSLKGVASSADSHHIDYRLVAQGDAYAAARELTASLCNADLTSLRSDVEKLAFWINIYNFLVVDAVIQLGIKQSVTEFRGFFDRVGYDIGGCFFSAHDIEQGILRANAGYPAVPGPQFAKNSPHAECAVSRLDWRVHFALNCAGESCPPIAYFGAKSIDSQLELAAKSFLNSSAVVVDVEARTATLSKIMQWYAPDFGASPLVTLGFGDASPILWTIAECIADDEVRVLLENDAESVAVRFSDYDWRLNGV